MFCACHEDSDGGPELKFSGVNIHHHVHFSSHVVCPEVKISLPSEVVLDISFISFPVHDANFIYHEPLMIDE